MEKTTLYYKQGNSDKIYSVTLEPTAGGYIVNYTYGRRGSTLSTGTKTPVAVDYAPAKAIYEKLISGKKAKGYTVGDDGTPYAHSDKTDTGIHCQLLNPIGDNEIEKLIEDPAFWMQQKFDGRRLLVESRAGVICGINRLGLSIALPQTIHTEVAALPLDVILDGEAVGDSLYVFDVLQIGDENLRPLPLANRHLRLLNLLASFQHPHIHMVKTAYTQRQKRELFDDLKKENAEGVVFKRVDSPYVPGRPASGGAQLKYKFCETASFIVGKVNAKRSVSLLLFDGEKIKAAGNVTIPPNHEVPSAGQVVECRYLYAFRNSGAIFQPVYLGVRDDIRSEECTAAQLKFKAGSKMEAT